MADTTTIEVTDEQKTALDQLKEHDKEAYKSVIDRLIASYNGEAIDNYSDAIATHSIDYEKLTDVLDERLQAHLAEWEITVNLDQLDLDPVSMDESDIENVVERYLEKNMDKLRRGQL